MKRLFLSLSLLCAITSAHADDAGDILKQIWSPYCKGVSLLECPSGDAEKLREEVHARLNAGESKEAILASLYERYGDQLRMTPEIQGRESLAYYLPYIFFILSLFILIAAILKRRKKIQPEKIEAKQSDDPKLKEKILKDLEERL
jgi:cytochrome c-type biogenesis protein CcmH/NrfF